jgi:hypothetical protein
MTHDLFADACSGFDHGTEIIVRDDGTGSPGVRHGHLAAKEIDHMLLAVGFELAGIISPGVAIGAIDHLANHDDNDDVVGTLKLEKCELGAGWSSVNTKGKGRWKLTKIIYISNRGCLSLLVEYRKKRGIGVAVRGLHRYGSGAFSRLARLLFAKIIHLHVQTDGVISETTSNKAGVREQTEVTPSLLSKLIS